jgi:hypothetical protein
MPRVLNYRHAVTQHVARRTRRWVDATPQPTHEPKAIDEGDGMNHRAVVHVLRAW